MRKRLSPLIAVSFLAAFCYLSLPTSANDAGKGAKAVTFSKDVAPIFYKNCVQCHRPNDIAPMSLLSYKEARPWARSIKEKVVTREMPPWHADPNHGNFSNDARLSEGDINTIAAWVDGGAKEGNPKDLPAAPKLSDKWELGPPDVVLSMPEAYTVEASGPDDYIYFRIPTGFKEDRWIQAAEFKPGNRKVVHHAVVFIETPELLDVARDIARRSGRDVKDGSKVPSVFEAGPGSIFEKVGTTNRVKLDTQVLDDGCSASHGGSSGGAGGAELLAVYAPGRNADVWPAGTAKKVPAGSSFIFQMHYSKTTGKSEKDLTSVGLYFAKGPIEKMALSQMVVNFLFKVPAGADNHEVTACHTLNRDVQFVNYMPHMHVRGKDMKYEVVYPDGRRETLLWVPRYDFNWQTLYKLKEPVTIPKGSKIIVTAHFDNSERNKYNPDPKKEVRFGEPTDYEMMVGFIDFIRDKPKERAVANINPNIYDAYVGQYVVGPGATFDIAREGDKLLLQSRGRAFQIFPESETVFFLKIFEGQITFVKNDKGEVTELVFERPGQVVRARRVNKAASAATEK